MSNPNHIADAESGGLLSQKTVAEVDAARKIFERCHSLLKRKVGDGLIAHLKLNDAEDGSVEGQARAEGFKAGMNTGLEFYPSEIDDIPIGEMLAAVYGDNEAGCPDSRPGGRDDRSGQRTGD